MAAWDWFLGLFKKDGTLNISDCVIDNITAEIFYKELALQSAVNLIANTITNAEILTFEKGKEIKKDNYYLFNVEPNQNKSGSKFWRDVINKLIFENECLVVQNDYLFYVADSFDCKRFALKENIYTDVVIADYPLKKSFMESQVLHFELYDQKIKLLIDGLYKSYGKLIAASSKHNLRKRARRGVVKVPANYPQNDEAQKELETLLGTRIKRYYEAEGGAALPLTNELEYEESKDAISNNPSQEGRDIRAFIDDIFDFVAISLNIPPMLLKGDIADSKQAFDNFITFCVKPIARILTDEINRKLYGKKVYLERTYAKVDTTRIKHVDIKDIANALDVLTRIGANSINENLRALGREEIDEDWANVRFITKNYDTIDNFMKGGE